jgi:hypothetical protein
MEDRDWARIAGALTAQTLLVEHLYRLYALQNPAPDGWKGLGAVQMALLDEQAPLYDEDMPPEARFAISQHALAHLEQFWARMGRAPALPPQQDLGQIPRTSS